MTEPLSEGMPERRARPRVADLLVVDDEQDIRELIELSLMRMGLGADTAGSVGEAQALLAERQYRLCLTDMRLPDGEGLDLVRHIAANYPRLPVAVITAHGSMDNAVSALKAGAFDYLSKPVTLEQLRALVKSALDVTELRRDAPPNNARALTGESAAIAQVTSLIERLARSLAPVYISGESGSGKERAARLTHELGPRKDKPFVAVNCGAIPENLMESEFFGYRKGAFTGADSDRDGFFHAANGGTLFLDEVADLPLAMQVKLLRVIQERRVRRVGEPQEQLVDVRIISATHQNLRDRVEQGLFRQDLFYRLNVIELRMPSLRERREDVPNLADTLLTKLAKDAGLAKPQLTEAAMAALCRYSFPGNVRELENILERALALSFGDEIDAPDLMLEPSYSMADAPSLPRSGAGQGLGLQEMLDAVERETISAAINQHQGNRDAAAEALGISARSLEYRIERLHL